MLKRKMYIVDYRLKFMSILINVVKNKENIVDIFFTVIG
jgi:hypothetical protein